ncbi:unnamed protein product [Urochloa decumbens]|uniref:Shadow of prion protein n=1 Tax=Urochloa decumbens TaxID=240449 RepID=A0ABC8ZH67_9POAL
MTRRFLPLCAVLAVLLCVAASMVDVAEARRGGRPGFRNTYYPARRGTRRSAAPTAAPASSAAAPGPWAAACLGSSLLAAVAAAVLL